MAYKKRYEDSYLDEENEDFDGSPESAKGHLMRLLQKKNKTQDDLDFMQKISNTVTSVEDWALIVETAESVGDRDFYYFAVDKMSSLS